MLVYMFLYFILLPLCSSLPYLGFCLLGVTMVWSLLLCSVGIHDINVLSDGFMLDAISSPLVSLTIWIIMLMVISSPSIVFSRSGWMFWGLLVWITWGIVMVFGSVSLLSFYFFFEATLIPTFLVIVLWGYQPERLQASLFFMMYTVCASLPLLVVISLVGFSMDHLSMILPVDISFLSSSMHFMWLACMLAFMVKMPLYGVHLWLPKAHVEAPLAGSMILAAVLLKLGSYGMVRILFLSSFVQSFMCEVGVLVALTGALITSFLCVRQSDMKALVAYASVSHMSFMMAVIVINHWWGLGAVVALMVGHGLISSNLFMLVNSVYVVSSSRSFVLAKGFLNLSPALGLWWFMGSIFNMGAPPNISFYSEIIMTTSVLVCSVVLVVFVLVMFILTGIYSVILYAASQHGSPMASMFPGASMVYSTSLLASGHIIPLVLMFLSPLFIYY